MSTHEHPIEQHIGVRLARNRAQGIGKGLRREIKLGSHLRSERACAHERGGEHGY